MAKTKKGKLPKELRKAGGRIAKVVNSPAGRELLSAGLTVAAAAVSAAVEKERGKRRGAIEPDAAVGGKAAGTPTVASPTPPTASNDPHEFGAALGKMAEAALAGLFKPKTK